MKPGIILLCTLITLAAACSAYSQNEAPGRTLPGGIWQPKNTHATIDSPINGHDPFNILTEWGDDKRLSDFGDSANSFDCEIAASSSHIYVAWEYFLYNSIFFAQSNDAGDSWTSYELSDDFTTQIAPPQIAASGSNVYVVYRGARPYWGIYLNRSNDYGQTWHNTTIYYTARNYSEDPVIASRNSSVYVLFEKEVNYMPPPEQDWDMYLYNSHDYGITFTDTFFVSDTTSQGIGPDMAVNCLESQPDPTIHVIVETGIAPNTQEIFYKKSTDGGRNWLGPMMISDNDSIHSFWPQITAWGDSNVIVSWTDYKYSHYDWTGDAFIAKSTDNGLSWSQPVVMTSNHGVTATDIYATDDTVILAYDDVSNGPAIIYANISYDGGLTWGGEQLVSDGNAGGYKPSVVISNGIEHVSWEDSRNDTILGSREIYYDKNQLETGIQDRRTSEHKGEFSLTAYPNPFNSSTMIMASNWKGGEGKIRIFDIGGRMVKTFNFGGDKDDKKIVWDACDSSGKKVSSGIYFARVSTPQTEKTIKLLYLK